MVDELTRDGVNTIKAVGNLGVEGIKLMASLLNYLAKRIATCETEQQKTKCVEEFNQQVDDLLKGNMPAGEFSKEVKDSAIMNIPDDVVADMFEAELKFQQFDYAKLDDKSFVVRSGDMELLNHVMQQTAVKLNDRKDMPQEEIKKQAKEELKQAKKGKTREQIEKKAQNKEKVKDVVNKLREQSEKKDHNRQREKQKTKNKQAER